MKLSDTKIKTAKPRLKRYRLTDGQGLSIMIHSNDTKTWNFRYSINQTEQFIAIGEYPIITLEAARKKRDEYRKMLFEGIDPKAVSDDLVKITFTMVTNEWVEAQKRWSDSHRNRVLQSLKSNVFPFIGDIPVLELTTQILIKPIKQIENLDKLELASRLQQRINAIVRYAVQQGYITYNPAQDLTGIVAKHDVIHRPALKFENITDLLNKIDDFKGRLLTKYALQFLLLTFVRSSELRFARWSEIDFERSLWTIPAVRQEIEGVKYSYRGAKMKTAHLVPLSKQSIELLLKIKELTGQNEFIFTSDISEIRPMSENTLNKALRLMGYDTKVELCSHGFRTMACSALVESNLWSSDAIELQMSHRERNKVRAAYVHKAEHITVRTQLMQWWSDYLDAIKIKFVMPYEFGLNH